MANNDNQDVRDLLAKLQAERGTLTAVSEPLREKRDAIIQKMRPLEKQVRDLDAQIRAVEQPRLADLDNQISGLAKILGGKRMSDAANEV